MFNENNHREFDNRPAAVLAMAAARFAVRELELGEEDELDWEDYDGGAVAGISIEDDHIVVPEEILLATPFGLVDLVVLFGSTVLFLWIPLEEASVYRCASKAKDYKKVSEINYAASLLVANSSYVVGIQC